MTTKFKDDMIYKEAYKCPCSKNLFTETTTEEGDVLARCKLCKKPYTFSKSNWEQFNGKVNPMPNDCIDSSAVG